MSELAGVTTLYRIGSGQMLLRHPNLNKQAQAGRRRVGQGEIEDGQ